MPAGMVAVKVRANQADSNSACGYICRCEYGYGYSENGELWCIGLDLWLGLFRVICNPELDDG